MFATTTQPQVFPALYMMERLAKCREVIFLMEAQVTRDHLRMDIGTKNGPLTISLPVKRVKGQRQTFAEAYPADLEAWLDKLLTTFELTYRKAPYYGEVMPRVSRWAEDIKSRNKMQPMTVGAVGVACYHLAIETMNLKTITHESTFLQPARPKNPTEWLAELTEIIDADQYVQGRKSMDAYFEPECFYERGIELYCQEFFTAHPVKGFPGLTGLSSWVDWAFQVGPAETSRLIKEAKSVQPWGKNHDN